MVIEKYVDMGIWECNSDVDRLYNARELRTKSLRIVVVNLENRNRK